MHKRDPLILIFILWIGNIPCLAKNVLPGVKTDGTASFTQVKKAGKIWLPAGAPVMEGPNGTLEVGVVVLPATSVAQHAIKEAKAAKAPPLIPYITLIQGLFSPLQIEKLKSYVQQLTNIPSAPLVMDKRMLLVGQNIFWDVKMTGNAGAAWLTSLNYLLSMHTHKKGAIPAASMWQTWDMIEAAKKKGKPVSGHTLARIQTYGRSFSLPGNNRPHITVGYGPLTSSQEKMLVQSQIPQDIQKPLMPKALALYQLDARGNIIKEIARYPIST
jgi:hypothetical protein